MKQNINPVTLFSIKEGARTENTLLKAKREGTSPVKLAALLKRNVTHETFSSEILRSRSFEILRVEICKRLYNKASLLKVNKEFNNTCRCQQHSCFRRCSTNQVFFKISQMSQENFCAGNIFLFTSRAKTCNCIKKMTRPQVLLCELIEILRTPNTS